MNREHEVLNAFAEALREAQITGLAFIRVNANGHVQALPSDRVRISVIQAVEERTAAAVRPECDHLWAAGPTSGPMPEYVECVKCRSRAPLPEDGGPVWYQECRDATQPAQCNHQWFRSTATGAVHCTLCREGLTGERKTK